LARADVVLIVDVGARATIFVLRQDVFVARMSVPQLRDVLELPGELEVICNACRNEHLLTRAAGGFCFERYLGTCTANMYTT
jgi:hypothetical protein